jgi:phosphoglycerate kinase
MKLNLRTLPPKHKIKGVPILVRVDWNVPEAAARGLEGSLKLERSVPFIKQLAKRGAIVILLTHFGRPKRKDKTPFDAVRSPSACSATVSTSPFMLSPCPNPRNASASRTDSEKRSQALSILLENVRFEKGEEKNADSARESLGLARILSL